MEAVLAKSDKTIVEPNGVVPYLPMGNARRIPDATAQTAQPAQPAETPAVTTGGGQ